MLFPLLSEIISYMGYEVTASHIDTNTWNNEIPDNLNDDKYFDIKIRNKKYPSCYQYNILIMLAKRLIKEDEELVIDVDK